MFEGAAMRLKVGSVLLGVIVIAAIFVIITGHWKAAEIAAAYRLPLRDSPYPPLSIPAAENHPGIYSLVGEILAFDTGTTNNISEPVLVSGDDYVKSFALPSSPISYFSITMQPRGSAASSVELEFCGANARTGIVYGFSEGTRGTWQDNLEEKLENKYALLVYAKARQGRANCNVLARIVDLTPQLQFKGFQGRPAEIMRRYFTAIDRFYGERLRGGKWEISRLYGCGDQECYRLFYKPNDRDKRSWLVWDANLSTGEITPLSEYAKTIENELRRSGEL
jgi:hypothetical protein